MTHWTRLNRIVLPLLGALVVACTGDDAGTATATATSTAGSTTVDTDGTTSTTATASTTATSTATGESTGTATSAGTTGTTDPGTTSTTGPLTDSGTTAATTEATTAATTEATTAATTEATTGGGDAECQSDDECLLFSDCCVCDAIHVDERVMECEKLCIIGTCESLGVTTVSCRLDACVAGRLHCDDSEVVCDAPVPQCDPGYLPEVNEGGTCYTGGCAPVHLCDYVPECSYCTDAQMCVIDVTQLGPKHRCEPVPAACADEPDCECAAQACDHEPYDNCAAEGGVLSCTCPQC